MLPKPDRKKHLLPPGHFVVHRLPKPDHEAAVEQHIVLVEPPSLISPGESGRGGAVAGNRPAQHLVQRVPDPGRAVVPVVVVGVAGVLRPDVPQEKIPQRRPLGRRQLQLLGPGLASLPAVEVHHAGDVGGLTHRVPHLALGKARKNWAGESRIAPSRRGGRCRRRCRGPRSRCARTAPRFATGLEGEQGDGELGAPTSWPVSGASRHPGAAPRGTSRPRKQRRHHSATSLPSSADW